MKRSVLFLVSLFVVTTMVAAPVSQQRAMQVAQQFIPVPDAQAQAPGMRAEELPSDIVYTHPMPKSGQPAFYVVNVGGSFVIVSADDVAHQVLGYNLGKNWPVAANGEVQLPPQVKGFFDDLAAQMEAAIEADPNHAPDAEWSQPQSAPRRRMLSEMPDSVGPLLTTTWDQGQYYNALCPEDQNSPYDGHCPTGCVATAMAQVINYWGYPVHGRGIHSYNTNYGMLTVNYDSAYYDFDHMPAQLTNTSTPQEIQAVATLMRDCGIALNMGYSSDESGAQSNDILASFVNYFLFSSNIQLSFRDLYKEEEWDSLLHANINSSLPVIYSGSDGFMGHSFVLDGYNGNYYHFNFGWSGYGDGWYRLGTINPTSNFALRQGAVMNIFPDAVSQTIVGNYGVSTFYVDGKMDFYNTFGKNSLRLPATIENYNDTLILIANNNSPLVVDFMSYEDETFAIYDGLTTDVLLRYIDINNTNNDFSPVVSTQNALTIINTFKLNPTGFHLRIGENASCRMVSNIETTIDSSMVNLSWIENGLATSWKVEYGPEGFAQGGGRSVVTTTNSIIVPINNPKDKIEFRIQPACDSLDNTLINSVTINKQRYWTNVVLKEPEGYNVDSTGVIRISSAEALAWLAKEANENWFYHGELNYLYNYDISIENDIDLGGYYWKPIYQWNGNFVGNGHTISNMNIYSSDYEAAMFWHFNGDTIRDIGFIDARVVCIEGATIAAATSDNLVAINCYSINHLNYATSCDVGGLFRYSNGTLLNCFSYGQMSASLEAGGLVAMGAPSMMNCFASVQSSVESNVGILCGSTMGGSFFNCFAEIDSSRIMQNSTSEITCFFGRYAQVGTLKNISGFSRMGNGFAYTTPNISNNYQYNGSIDLVSALNQGLVEINSPLLRTWTWDSITGLPKFADYFEVTCPNVSNIKASNVYVDDGFAVELSWQENGLAEEWEIKCLPYGIIDEDSALYFNSHSTTFNVTGLTLARRYDFYIRPLCGDSSHVVWGMPISFWADKAYWVDVVTTCPEGYVEDSYGNVFISTPEALAWLSVCSNQLNGQTRNTYNGKTIYIIADLDMGAYRWSPICQNDYQEWMFKGTLDGGKHTISNLYCREDEDYQGLIGHARHATFNDIRIINSFVYGNYGVGTLFGEAYESLIDNCSVENSIVRGTEFVGCLGGVIHSFGDTCLARNSFSSGIVYGIHQVGGLVGMNTSLSNISNCYSIANVVSHDFGYKGGLVGGVDGTVSNCYSAGMVSSDNPSFTGSVMGTLYPDYCKIHNIYGIRQDNIPLIGDVTWGAHVVSDTSSFSTLGVLETIVSIENNSYTDLLSALNAWVDANNNDSIYRHWVADTAMVNGGFPIFAPMPVEPVGPGTEIDNYKETNRPARKVFERGHLYILLPDGTRFDATGRKLE